MPNTGTNSATNGTEPFSAADDWIRLDEVSFAYGVKPVVRDVSFAIAKGEFVTLLGPSGCGKTTLLSLIAGHLRPSVGTVSLRGCDATAIEPAKRRIGTVIQNYALFPHLSVRDNVGFGLDVRKTPKPERNARVEAMLTRVGLTPDQWQRRPLALSGGQQQRTAIARALVIEPDVLLLDEPFANLDRRLRENLRDELRRLQSSLGVTTILVTHDQEEAMQISDRIGILREGSLLQFDTPEVVYRNPANAFVATLTGLVNILKEWQGRTSPGGFAVRPESVRIGDGANACEWRRMATIRSIAFKGSGYLGDVATDDGIALSIAIGSENRPPIGARLQIGIPEASVWPLS